MVGREGRKKKKSRFVVFPVAGEFFYLTAPKIESNNVKSKNRTVHEQGMEQNKADRGRPWTSEAHENRARRDR